MPYAYRKIAMAAALLGAGLTGPRPAAANGRPAATASVAKEVAGGHRLLVGATFGTLVSEDNGATWQLICEGPLGTAGQPIDPVYRTTTAGLLVVTSPMGILYSTDAGCNFAQAGGASANQSFLDVAVSPTDPMRLLAASNTRLMPNGIFLSTDGGRTFSAPPNPVPNVIFRSVRFAPSNAQRAYALSYDGINTVAAVYRSDDGGATFLPTGATAPASSPALIGADPRNADTVYFYGQPSGMPWTLYRSQNGGASFTPVSSDILVIRAAAFADSGTLYLATDKGVRKSPDGTSISPAIPGATVVRCLSLIDGALYGCADDGTDGFAVGRSTDDGATWTPLLHLSQNITGPQACPAGSQVCDQCYSQWSTFAMQFGLPNTQTPQCAMGQVDAGAGGSGGSGGGGGGGCSCSVGSRVPRAAAALGLPTALLAVLFWTRRKGRGRR